MSVKNGAPSICLYGTREHGFGWIAMAGGESFGDGELRSHSATNAVWGAADALRKAGFKRGPVEIFAPGGEKMAKSNLKFVPSYGLLEWGPAPVYTISAAEIFKKAEVPS